jgi:hypothetical protein
MPARPAPRLPGIFRLDILMIPGPNAPLGWLRLGMVELRECGALRLAPRRALRQLRCTKLPHRGMVGRCREALDGVRWRSVASRLRL